MMVWLIGGFVVLAIGHFFMAPEIHFLFGAVYVSFWFAFAYGFTRGMQVGREEAEKEFKRRR